MKPGSDVILHTPQGMPIKAKNISQSRILNAYHNNDIIFAIGPAGTGKTYCSVALAVAALQRREIKRIVLSRPAVEAGEKLGFLPGDLREKIDPYLRPLYDALGDMLPYEKLQKYLDKGVIEVAPLAYLRGRTLNNCFVILDEAQNCTYAQLKMLLTRLGPRSKTIITGDVTQTDLPHRNMSGLRSAYQVLGHIADIGFVFMDPSDVVRHRLVAEIIDAYEYYEGSQESENEAEA